MPIAESAAAAACMQKFKRAVEEAQEVLDRRRGVKPETAHMPHGALPPAPCSMHCMPLPSSLCEHAAMVHSNIRGSPSKGLDGPFDMHADFLDPSTFAGTDANDENSWGPARARNKDMRPAPLDAEAAGGLRPAAALQLLHAVARGDMPAVDEVAHACFCLVVHG